MTTIEWTRGDDGLPGKTWNPTTGCDKISPGCGLPRFDGDDTGGCYALAMAARLKAMGQAKYQNDGDPRTSGPGFGLTVHPDALTVPLHWRKPYRVFVNSMSDLGHARVPREFLARVWAVMASTPHTYQILTKRPERMARILRDECHCGAGHAPGVHFRSAMEWAATSHSDTYVPGLTSGIFATMAWPLPNVHLGTSIELDTYARRADDLRETPAAVRFLSLEPLLGPLPSLNLQGIDWAIIGGESGPGSRPLDLGWVRGLIAQCRDAGTAVFVKQLGSCWAHDNGLSDKGGKWDLWPADLRVREFPVAAQAAAS
jgi:protein gp37